MSVNPGEGLKSLSERISVAGVDVSPAHFIGGERVASEDTFTDLSPIDEQPLGEIARGGQREADLAVAAATEAFPAWAALGATGRAAYLHRLADLIDANVDRLAAVECVDMAMLLRSLKARLINRGARNYRSYADLAVAYEERVWDSNGTHNRVIRMPSGPAVVITPWNAPFMLSTWKTAPALAAGSTMILKPAEWSPLSCSVLADLVDEAGFPPGVFNIVQGIGEEIGAALVSHPGVRRISFTGSPETARHIGVAAAKNIVPFTGELGGKGPLLVFDDCDLEAAARKAAGQFDDAGQVCLAGTRILVQESIAEQFLELFHRFADEHVLGDPRDDDTTVTPLIHRDHFDRVAGFVERARANGDEIVRGGHPAARGGLFYEPTLVVPRSNESEIVQREVFGPVLTVQTFADEDEGVALANSTPYGLSGIIYTGSAERAERVGRAVRAGTVWVNYVPRTRSHGSVRRDRDLRHRPRGRRLRPRLLLRSQDPPDRRRHDRLTMSATGLVWHERMMWHDTGSGASELPSGGWLEPGEHAESPATKRRLKNLLDATGLTDDLVLLAPRAATIEELCRVHAPEYVERIRALSTGRGGDAGSEAPFGNGSFPIAQLAAGGTITAIDAVLDREVRNAYALVRPPGHHALSDRGMGFCLFANVAVGIRHAQAARGLGRVAVVDWDVHHGNGTQAIFWHDPSVLAISLHQDGLYPARSGLLSETGVGEGAGTTLNVPLPAGSGTGAYLDAIDRVVVPALEEFAPELVVIACGFDAGALDPLGRMQLPAAAFGAMTERLLDVTGRLCGGRLVASHEGGYSAGHVPFCGLSVIEALSGLSAGIDDPFAYLADIPGQELVPHQRAAVDAAAALVPGVPR